MKIIISQFASINNEIFSKYISKEFRKQKPSLIVLGEYVSNLFFKEYKDKTKLQKTFLVQEKYFTQLAKKYLTTIIVPIIECKDKEIFKSIMITNKDQVYYYRTQKLMEMEHWNEANFFNNTKVSLSKLKEPFIFNIDGLNISVLSGWESHFDEFWIKLKKKNIDIVIVPTANTFNSNARWARMLQTRSFLNNCFVVRVNRIGSYFENNIEWKFYGNSFISLPNGNLGDMLGDKEGILVSQIDKELIDEAKNIWKFK
ncbi:carbon-nitrogen hydrolase family protein [Helicobacter sp. MIT 14-3879]|uniref:carbon-nitrogen hydrolase family protein n=1 Tax=Helicobacter sp. MIT 14-3879 TaxID=2040649 RepID=UPI000E1ED782|nr:carbon-nitrogen hydrolase family protein [Helicobacter sp. MIT 14-3879]RDU65633.1 carbon-nitrogen hydrolase family protein [Helicobacter sp. MIT 14-3879]